MVAACLLSKFASNSVTIRRVSRERLLRMQRRAAYLTNTKAHQGTSWRAAETHLSWKLRLGAFKSVNYRQEDNTREHNERNHVLASLEMTILRGWNVKRVLLRKFSIRTRDICSIFTIYSKNKIKILYRLKNSQCVNNIFDFIQIKSNILKIEFTSQLIDIFCNIKSLT